jgi:uncharacterized protein YqgV (UPF0045/DUF77 family)
MKINAALQLLPLVSSVDKIAVIDRAISVIAVSGLKYQVCPFETVVEGEADDVYTLIRKIQETVLKHGCEELLFNVKIHAANRDLFIADKMEKYA